MSTTLTAHAVEARGVRKSFGDHVVLDGVDLTIPEGGIVALLGPNGAGKTTLVRIMTTLVAADGGEVDVLGHRVGSEDARVREVIGVTGQFSAVDGLLTGRENLRLMTRLNHLSPADGAARIDELLASFDLVDAADRPATTYSGGMKRRLDLAMSLVARPRVLFLDEPTTGLDPTSRHTLWDHVRRLAAEGTSVLLTTQYLDEADRLADRIAVLHGGRIVAEGTSRELTSMVGDGSAEITVTDVDTLDRAAASVPGAVADSESLTLHVPHSGDVGALRELLADLDRAGVQVDDLRLRRPDLDDVFRILTQKEQS